VKRLIVNADDYGRAPSVSAGIRQAHQQGIVTSTTAMMNMPGVVAELRTALAECPNLGLGVHLSLTAGVPVLPPERLPAIVGLADGLRFPKLDRLFEAATNLPVEEVKAEWRAQIEKFIRATGRPPTHLDSHHHTSYLTPPMFSAMLDLAREHGCAIRTPVADRTDLSGDLPPTSDLVEMAPAFIAPLLAASGVSRPDHFEPHFYGHQATVATLLTFLDQLPDGVTELMCHPGLPDPGMAAVSSYNIQRAAELAVLTNARVRERVRERGIELISFGALK
jgi:predicted glycoside hydrolase/deacetylase ChbG (UPF0249 family)